MAALTRGQSPRAGRTIRPARSGRQATLLLIAIAFIVGASWVVDGLGDRDPIGAGKRPTEFHALAAAHTERELDRLLPIFAERARVHPSILAHQRYAELLLAKGRLTGDADLFADALRAARAGHALDPTDARSIVLLAAARASMHDFAGALTLARSAEGLNPLLIVADASIAVGRYAEAGAALERARQLGPSVAEVAVRRARFAYLHGRIEEAAALARGAETAADAAGTSGAGLAFFRVVRATIAFDTGAYDEALRLAGSAVELAPRYHVALAAHARSLAAVGRIEEAIGRYEEALRDAAHPELLSALGDLHAVQGHARLAHRRYDEAVDAARDTPAPQLESRALAMHWADHGINTSEAVGLALAGLRFRRDIEGYDAAAWALHGAGRHGQAAIMMSRALALGTPDASLHYHAGMIELARGNEARARAHLEQALQLSPRFDPLQAPRARAALARAEETGD